MWDESTWLSIKKKINFPNPSHKNVLVSSLALQVCFKNKITSKIVQKEKKVRQALQQTKVGSHILDFENV